MEELLVTQHKVPAMVLRFEYGLSICAQNPKFATKKYMLKPIGEKKTHRA